MNERAAQETFTPGSKATAGQTAPSTNLSEDMIWVLYADDEESLRKIVRMYLEIIDTSLVIESVSSAADALKVLEKRDYDCFVSDYQTFRLNGIDFAQIVKRKHDVPFIIYTGRGRGEVNIIS
jgi:DNA-binding NtrC family response regulator